MFFKTKINFKTGSIYQKLLKKQIFQNQKMFYRILSVLQRYLDTIAIGKGI